MLELIRLTKKAKSYKLIFLTFEITEFHLPRDGKITRLEGKSSFRALNIPEGPLAGSANQEYLTSEYRAWKLITGRNYSVSQNGKSGRAPFLLCTTGTITPRGSPMPGLPLPSLRSLPRYPLSPLVDAIYVAVAVAFASILAYLSETSEQPEWSNNLR